MKIVSLSVLIVVFSITFSFSIDFKRTSYDIVFQKFDEHRSNDIMKLLENGLAKGMKSAAELEFYQGYDLVYSAVKRIGELRLTNDRIKTKVREIIQLSNPYINKNNAEYSAKIRYIFNIAVWTLGRIGNDDDISLLSTYIPSLLNNESYFGDSLYFMIQAFGEAYQSDIALYSLHYMSYSINSEILMKEIISAIVRHGSFNSVSKLIDLKETRKSKFSPEFLKFIEDAIEKLSK